VTISGQDVLGDAINTVVSVAANQGVTVDPPSSQPGSQTSSGPQAVGVVVGDNDTLKPGHDGTTMIAAGNNETFDGLSSQSLVVSGEATTMIADSVSAFMTGTTGAEATNDTFNSTLGDNIMIGGQGTNTFEIGTAIDDGLEVCPVAPEGNPFETTSSHSVT
jgi:hypothetical protein